MWHEARRSEKKVHELMDAAKRRAERRAVFLSKRRGDPQQSLRIVASRCRLYHDSAFYHSTQDEHGLIPWNGKEDNLIDRFDGRALLDYIWDYNGQHAQREKTEEEEELEELVNFERYRDLIKQRRQGLTDEGGLEEVDQELESRSKVPFTDKHGTAPGKGSHNNAQFSYSYETEPADDPELLDSGDEEEEEADDLTSSEDSEDEEMENIAKGYGVESFSRLVHLERKTKEEERKQKEAAKCDLSMKKLSRKERRKFAQQEREKEKEAARMKSSGTAFDPYREQRGSPTYESYHRSRRERRRGERGVIDVKERDTGKIAGKTEGAVGGALGGGSVVGIGGASCTGPPKIEYITEFEIADVDGGSSRGGSVPPLYSPYRESHSRHQSSQILEAVRTDPAAVLDNNNVVLPSQYATWDEKAAGTNASALAKLQKTPSAARAPAKKPESEKKETPQERLKRIMSKQLNKQIKKDTITGMAKRREQEKQRQEKLAETRSLARRWSRSRSRSRSVSPSWSSRRDSHSYRRHSRSPPAYRHHR
eukprot:TRINITY_DN2761_c0_g2_i1.p1 TRINITY_DN2761_c0_g2~~TRINITY_DN2761_c0_g2_i1.p1  ORF type:complete len:537 (-),score=134.05 TRINITY_DN2761_c0_g2_i1:836-2446(-)